MKRNYHEQPAETVMLIWLVLVHALRGDGMEYRYKEHCEERNKGRKSIGQC
jgi:hypothetical protein